MTKIYSFEYSWNENNITQYVQELKEITNDEIYIDKAIFRKIKILAIKLSKSKRNEIKPTYAELLRMLKISLIKINTSYKKYKKDHPDEKLTTIQAPTIEITPKSNISSTKRKTYLTEDDIRILNDRSKTPVELEQKIVEIESNKTKDPNADIRIDEYKRKIAQLTIKNKIEDKIKYTVEQYKFDYDSIYQFSNSSTYRTQPNQQNDDLKSKYQKDTIESIKNIQQSISEDEESKKYYNAFNNFENYYENFSELNVGIYPKLISLMINPEIFCKMWYDSYDFYDSTNSKKTSINPYNIINSFINMFFIKCYEYINVPPTNFKTGRDDIIKRDTQLFKAIYIQNLISLKDKLIEENMFKKEFTIGDVKVSEEVIEEYVNYTSNVIINFINNKIKEVLENKNEYIFNYKLLNEMKNYHDINKQYFNTPMSTYSEKNSEFESLLELYYYFEQISKSHDRLTKFTEIIKPSTTEQNKYVNLIITKYNEMVSNFAQVLTYVKERNDGWMYGLTNELNPRYKISLTTEQLVKDSSNNIIRKATEIDRNKPIVKSGKPQINFYDFGITYFNYPKAIGFKNEDDPYYNSADWIKNPNGTYKKSNNDNTNSFNFDVAQIFVNKNERYLENYKLGKINRYYGYDIKSEDIAQDPECGLVLLNKLRNFENVIIVGNGQSGAGKTAALISRTDDQGTVYPGILPCLTKYLIKPKDEKLNDKTQYFEKATLKLINLYLKLDDNLNDIDKMTSDHYYPYNIKLYETDDKGKPIIRDGNKTELDVPEYSFEPSKDGKTWICTTEGNKIGRTMDQLIAEAFEIREVEPTKNNPNSSRSHIVVCATFTGKKVKESLNDNDEGSAKIVICDLAGVEDKFTCELSELMILDRNYNTKSDKYKILGEENNKIIRSHPIQFDNYFCTDIKYHNQYLLPNSLLELRKKNIDMIVKYIKQYNDILKGIDPIENTLKSITSEFESNHITEKDFEQFKKLVEQTFSCNENEDEDCKLVLSRLNKLQYTPSTKQQGGSSRGNKVINKHTSKQQQPENKISKKQTPENPITPLSIPSIIIPPNQETIPKPSTKSNITPENCDISDENTEIINNFMMDFKQLDNEFATNKEYLNKSNKQIVEIMKEDINALINGNVDSIYNMDVLTDIGLNNDIVKQLKNINNTSTEVINLLNLRSSFKEGRTNTETIINDPTDSNNNLMVKLKITDKANLIKDGKKKNFITILKSKSVVDTLITNEIVKEKIIFVKNTLNQLLISYYKDLYIKRKNIGTSKIKEFKKDERKKQYGEIKKKIQELTRFLQLEFNCILRRKEGFMINTSLKEMQKFIGSILFESAKRRFSKVLIENNLLKLDREEIYSYNDYVRNYTKIILIINDILTSMDQIIENKNNVELIEKNINVIIKNTTTVKKYVLKYFMNMMTNINGNYKNYKPYFDLPTLLVYICFINMICKILINDQINYDIISYALENMGDEDYKKIFIDIKEAKYNSNQTLNYNQTALTKMKQIYSELFNIENNNTKENFKILNAFYRNKNENKPPEKPSNEPNFLKNFYDMFSGIFTITENLQTKNPEKIYNPNHKEKINYTNDNFTSFHNDLKEIWKILKKHTTTNIENFQKEIKSATYDNKSFHPTPLLYTSASIDTCIKNKNKYENEYEKFYDYKKNDSALEFLFEIMVGKPDKPITKISDDGKEIKFENVNGFGLEIENSTLVIFTVINLTPNPTAPTNNPPTPPFININKLKLIYKMITINNQVEGFIRGNKSLQKKIIAYSNYFNNKLLKYPFYESFKDTYTPILTNLDAILFENGKNLKEKIIDFIDSNNATTLIGTVEFEKFTKIRDPTQPYLICDDKEENLNKQIEQLNEMVKTIIPDILPDNEIPASK